MAFVLENELMYLFRIGLACLCGGIIGIERQRRVKVAGIKTHMMIAIAAALMMLISKYGFMDVLGAQGVDYDVSRVAAGIITGMGILSGGIVFTSKQGYVSGITTAAGMWATAAIGIALGYGFYGGAVIATIACMFTSAFLSRIERKRKENTHIYIELDVTKKINDVLDKIRNELDSEAMIEAVAPKSNVSNTVGVYVTVSNLRSVEEIKGHIDGIEGIIFWIIE